MEKLDDQVGGQIEWEESGAQIGCKIWWNYLVKKFRGETGGQFGDKVGFEHLCQKFGEKYGAKIDWKNEVK